MPSQSCSSCGKESKRMIHVRCSNCDFKFGSADWDALLSTISDQNSRLKKLEADLAQISKRFNSLVDFLNSQKKV